MIFVTKVEMDVIVTVITKSLDIPALVSGGLVDRQHGSLKGQQR